MTSGSLQPTWYGHVTTTRDALILFEACLNGTLHHVPRRPHDRERGNLIKSGSVFIYEENASGIKRWTDGVPWSPSRILGNFLVYRELTKPFPPGEKKRATKRNKRATKPGEPYPRMNGSGSGGGGGSDPISPTTPGLKSDGSLDNRESERALIGSLVDSYGFKEGGLVKKTMSVNVQGVHHHLVSYYRICDAMDGTLGPPCKDPRFGNIEPRVELVARQNFRAPLDETEDGIQDPSVDNNHQSAYGYDNTSYDPRRHQYSHSQPGHAHFPIHNMTSYTHAQFPYSSAPQLQQSMQAFTGIPTIQTTQGYYPTSHAVSQSLLPIKDEYAAYTPTYQTTTSTPITPSIAQISQLQQQHHHQPQQQQQQQQQPQYPFRQPTHHNLLTTRSPTTLLDAQDQKQQLDPYSIPRPTSVYAPTAPQPQQQQHPQHHQQQHHQTIPSPTYATAQQWNNINSMTLPVTRPEAAWVGGGDTQGWGLQAGLGVRGQTYSATGH